MINKYVIYCIYKYINIVMMGRSFSLGYFRSRWPNRGSVRKVEEKPVCTRQKARADPQSVQPPWRERREVKREK